MTNEEIINKAEEFAEKHGFRVPYDGSNEFYDKTDVKASVDGFTAGAKWAVETMIEKACNWIIDNFVTSDIDDYGDTSAVGSFRSVESMIEDFQKSMEE